MNKLMRDEFENWLGMNIDSIDIGSTAHAQLHAWNAGWKVAMIHLHQHKHLATGIKLKCDECEEIVVIKTNNDSNCNLLGFTCQKGHYTKNHS